MNPTNFTLECGIPSDVGVLTYSISASSKSRPTRISVPYGSTVEHPTAGERGPWMIQYQITNAAAPRKVFAQGQQTVYTAPATLNVGFAIATDPPSSLTPPSPVPDPGDEDASWFGIEDLPAEEAGADADLTQQLAYVQQSQQQTQWCWAAVTSSVAGFYGDANPAYSQCRLANWAHGQSNCCSAGGSAQCNQPYQTHAALQHVGHLAATVESAISFAAVQQEIDGLHPVAVAIGWYGGGGHAVVVSGYATVANTAFLHVQDPAGVMTGWFAMSDFPGSQGYWRRTNTTL